MASYLYLLFFIAMLWGQYLVSYCCVSVCVLLTNTFFRVTSVLSDHIKLDVSWFITGHFMVQLTTQSCHAVTCMEKNFYLALNIINNHMDRTSLWQHASPSLIVHRSWNDTVTHWLAQLQVFTLAHSEPQGGDNSLWRHPFCLGYNKPSASGCRPKRQWCYFKWRFCGLITVDFGTRTLN